MLYSGYRPHGGPWGLQARGPRSATRKSGSNGGGGLDKVEIATCENGRRPVPSVRRPPHPSRSQPPPPPPENDRLRLGPAEAAIVRLVRSEMIGGRGRAVSHF